MKSVKEIWVSKASLNYLQSDEIEAAFCGNCQWKELWEGTFDHVTGFGEPPHEECPADFDIGSERCPEKKRYWDILEGLVEIDKKIGLKREVKIIL